MVTEMDEPNPNPNHKPPPKMTKTISSHAGAARQQSADDPANELSAAA